MHHPHAYAVIGANFGDEAKGLATDAIVAQLVSAGELPLVVRSNGGAQAGHGVETPDGRHHVFHHVGSGSFSGAPTHLSRFFVAHPMFLAGEIEGLSSKLPFIPQISIDPRAYVTTPWDVFINQAAEIARGNGRHGSCGMGFGETIVRNLEGSGLSAGDLNSKDLLDRLMHIRDGYVMPRLEQIGVADNPWVQETWPILTSDAVLERFLEDIRGFRNRVSLRPDAELGSSQVVFEGAQGLMLDMDLGVMPHLTRSNTGLKNMAAIAEEAGITQISPTYMTRAYMTRHGAGPLKHEADISAWAAVIDRTNAPNEWQGNLRFAPLDLDETRDFISRDMAAVAESGVDISPAIGISCLDQLQGTARLIKDGVELSVAEKDMARMISDGVALPVSLESRGPHRQAVSLLGFQEDMK